ncbi:MAG: PilZ domain-containing protein [Desulfuromonadaceae bacterium]|nr:PilZ domain-containing protein [Desulfuromonadaceae bacterium]
MAEHTILISATAQKLLNFDYTFAARENFNLIVAQDSADLFITARAQHPDIIYITPNDSETHTTEKCCGLRLKDDPATKDIPIIAILDGNNKSDLKHCQIHRPDDILFTPLSSHLFLTSARRILGLPHRSFDRVQTSLRVYFGPNRNNLRPACSYNLSTGGIFIATETEIALNTQLTVKLDIPDTEKPIICESVVSWINHSNAPEEPDIPAGIGLQFLSLNAADLFAIHNYTNKHRNNT